MDDTHLVPAAQGGDLDAFNTLIVRYQDTIYQRALWLLGDEEAAEDATQEAFLRAYRKLRQFRGGSLRAWLLRIVTNLCYDELQRIRFSGHYLCSIEISRVRIGGSWRKPLSTARLL